ncbi:MAG: type II toxin-antitoxin system VapC family toxin [Thermomicrobiales bacterium]
MNDRPLPLQVYLDTSIIFAAMFRESENWAAGSAFCRRLVEEGCQVYFSQIVRLELSEAIRKLATIPGRTPYELGRQFQLDQWEQSIFIRRRWFQFGVEEFELLLARFAQVNELPFDQAIWLKSITVMTDERLRSHDAIHVATAREYRVPCIATTDDHFLRITDPAVRLLRDDPSARN